MPKHTSGMCTANDSACICRAWSRWSCSTGAKAWARTVIQGSDTPPPWQVQAASASGRSGAASDRRLQASRALAHGGAQRPDRGPLRVGGARGHEDRAVAARPRRSRGRRRRDGRRGRRARGSSVTAWPVGDEREADDAVVRAVADVGVEAAELAARRASSSRPSPRSGWPVTHASPASSASGTARRWRRAAGWPAGSTSAHRVAAAGPRARRPRGARAAGAATRRPARGRRRRARARAATARARPRRARSAGRAPRAPAPASPGPRGAAPPTGTRRSAPRPATRPAPAASSASRELGALEQRLGVADEDERGVGQPHAAARRARSSGTPGLALEHRELLGDGRRRELQRVGHRGDRAARVQLAQEAQPAEVEHRQATLLSHRQESESLLRSRVATAWAACPRTGALFCLASAAAFGAMGVFGKLAYDEGATVGTLLAVRFVLAAALLWLAVLATGRLGALRALPRRDVALALALGAVGYSAQAGALLRGARAPRRVAALAARLHVPGDRHRGRGRARPRARPAAGPPWRWRSPRRARPRAGRRGRAARSTRSGRRSASAPPSSTAPTSSSPRASPRASARCR